MVSEMRGKCEPDGTNGRERCSGGAEMMPAEGACQHSPRDCAVCDTEEAMLTVIDRDVEFDGPLSDAQRERLLAIANRCPVHLTLTSRIDIRTTLRASSQERVPGADPATS